MDYRLRSKDIIICLFLLVLAYIASFIILTQFSPQLSANTLDVDETYYYEQAKKLVDGTYILNYYRPIGFPLILAGALYLANYSLFGAKLILMFISALRAPLLYIFMKRLTGNFWISLISGIIFAIWPTSVFLSTTFYSETVSSTFFLLFINLLPFGESYRIIWRWILAGIVLGILIMVHPSFLIYIPFLFLIIFLENHAWKSAFKNSFLTLLGVAVVIAPWSYVISQHEGRFVLLSANSADALAGGLNENLIKMGYQLVEAPNGRMTWIGPGMWTSNSGYLNEEEQLLPPTERNDLLFSKVMAWMESHPSDVVYLEAAKLANIWGIYPIFPQLKKRFYFGNIPIILCLILALCALWTWRKEFRRTSRLWTVMIFVCFVALAACGSWRYRAPADAAMIALAVMFVYFKINGRTT